MSAMLANKVLLQELNQLIGIELLTSDFLEIFGSLFEFPRGKCPFSPLQMPMHSRIIFTTKVYSFLSFHVHNLENDCLQRRVVTNDVFLKGFLSNKSILRLGDTKTLKALLFSRDGVETGSSNVQ